MRGVSIICAVDIYESQCYYACIFMLSRAVLVAAYLHLLSSPWRRIVNIVSIN